MSRPDIIKDDQTGFLIDWYIGQNICILEDITFYTKMQNALGIILSIDFEKAFDSVNWNFLFRTLENINLGKFINYVQTIIILVCARGT